MGDVRYQSFRYRTDQALASVRTASSIRKHKIPLAPYNFYSTNATFAYSEHYYFHPDLVGAGRLLKIRDRLGSYPATLIAREGRLVLQFIADSPVLKSLNLLPIVRQQKKGLFQYLPPFSSLWLHTRTGRYRHLKKVRPPFSVEFERSTNDLDALHPQRLMSVEEKHFKRLRQGLLNPRSLISTAASLPSPPPEPATDDDTQANPVDGLTSKWREEVLLECHAFESSIIRIELLQQSNARERERYASEKLRIEQTAEAVRKNTMHLRTQLKEAQKTLEVRKKYDQLADKIMSNKALKAREDQNANLEKLNGEISELEKESRNYAQTWVERREQFGRIVEEGRQMLKLIRDEKEEAERKEGMEGGGSGDEGDSSERRGGSRSGSRQGTPRPGGSTPRPDGAATPRPDAGGTTPMHGEHLTPQPKPLPSNRSRLGISSPTLSSSRQSSPARQEQEQQQVNNKADVVMLEVPTNGTPAADTEIEEGEEEEGEAPDDGASGGEASEGEAPEAMEEN
ncbi:MAG: hypothetical protein M1820_001633 [Bogoriella megaspora]|nr:MAG: hypothetical protein M1820_001633 [Bogoriella megaspora]